MGRAAITLKPEWLAVQGDLDRVVRPPTYADTSGHSCLLCGGYPFACLEQRDPERWAPEQKRCGTSSPTAYLTTYQPPDSPAYPGDSNEGYPVLTRVCAVRRTSQLEDPGRSTHSRMLYALERYVAARSRSNRAWLPNDGYHLLSEKLIAR